jgi:hypothetical protein
MDTASSGNGYTVTASGTASAHGMFRGGLLAGHATMDTMDAMD